jgi:hypothetical protein
MLGILPEPERLALARRQSLAYADFVSLPLGDDVERRAGPRPSVLSSLLRPRHLSDRFA